MLEVPDFTPLNVTIVEPVRGHGRCDGCHNVFLLESKAEFPQFSEYILSVQILCNPAAFLTFLIASVRIHVMRFSLATFLKRRRYDGALSINKFINRN